MANSANKTKGYNVGQAPKFPSFLRMHHEMKTTLLVSLTILLVSPLTTKATELDDNLGLSGSNVSTNTIVISTNLLNSVSQGVCGTAMDILDTSPDPFFLKLHFEPFCNGTNLTEIIPEEL